MTIRQSRMCEQAARCVLCGRYLKKHRCQRIRERGGDGAIHHQQLRHRTKSHPRWPHHI